MERGREREGGGGGEGGVGVWALGGNVIFLMSFFALMFSF